jgi:hypothetical protein
MNERQIESHNSGQKQSPDVWLLYQCTESTFLDEFGIYKVNPKPGEFRTVNIEELALFSPLQLYMANPLSFDGFNAISLNKKPILFS